MSEEKPSRRRWYQFGLGTMLWLMLTTALAVYGFNEHRKRVQAEDELRSDQVDIFDFPTR
jgi:hypothetical protein